MKRFLTVSAVFIVLLAGLWMLRTAFLSTDAPPHYGWTAGTRLVYAYASESVSGQGQRRDENYRLTLWVMGPQEDEGVEVLFHKEGQAQYHDTHGYVYSPSPIREWGRFILYADGQVSDVTPEYMLLHRILPRVPESWKEECAYRFEWQDVEVAGRIYDMRPGGFMRNTFAYTIEEQHHRLGDIIHEDILEVVWHAGRKTVEKVTVRQQLPARSHQLPQATMRLKSFGTISSRERNKLLPDLERFLNARERYQQQGREHYAARPRVYDAKTFFQWRKGYDRQAAILQEAWRETRNEALRREIEAMIDGHGPYSRRQIERYREQQEAKGTPAPDWELTDFDGVAHRLEAYRGQVLLLDFWAHWYRPCIQAMPVIKEVQQHFSEKPFTVIGMNIDRNDHSAKAQEIIKRFDIAYPVLKASNEELGDLYPVHTVPTFIVIDRDGIMRHIQTGFSETLKEELIAAVKVHLPDNDGAANQGQSRMALN